MWAPKGVVCCGEGGARARGRGEARGKRRCRECLSGVLQTTHTKAVHDGGAAQAWKGYVSSVSKGQLWTSK